MPSARLSIWKAIVVFLIIVIFHSGVFGVSPIFAQEGLKLAQAPTPTVTTAPVGTGWQFDSEVTLVGKGAERARQLLWWVFSHPGLHNAGVLAQLWSISRNIVYIFVILLIVAFGFSFILLRKRASAVNIPPILVKIGGVLLYTTFSYVLVLALIQMSEIVMRFFIENIGGKDLFNVIFAGGGNSETNYTSFVGYKNVDPIQQEMVRASLFLINLTW